MRKAFSALLFLSFFLMCGCSVPALTSYGDNYVETLTSWSFQYNERTNDYSLFFGLLNKNDESISANVDVDIRIVNEKDEEVYKGTKSVFQNDFDYYTSQAAGEQYLAEVRISSTDISTGKSSNGTVYFTVFKCGTGYFGEVNCTAFLCVTRSDVELGFDSWPV